MSNDVKTFTNETSRIIDEKIEEKITPQFQAINKTLTGQDDGKGVGGLVGDIKKILDHLKIK